MPAAESHYTKRDVSISLEKANWYSLLAAGPLALGFVVLYFIVWGYEKPLTEITGWFPVEFGSPLRLIVTDLVAIAIFALLVAVHELIHGLTWKLAAGLPWRAIQFGFQVRTLSPYAHCREPLPAWAYRLGTLMPGLLTGVIPALVGVAIGSLGLALAGSLLVLVAGGDLTVLHIIRKVPAARLVEDHPTRGGCYVLDPVAKETP